VEQKDALVMPTSETTPHFPLIGFSGLLSLCYVKGFLMACQASFLIKLKLRKWLADFGRRAIQRVGIKR
jgi:hypothetical protein